MNNKKNVFFEFLKKQNLYTLEIEKKFESFYNKLVNMNGQINLFSRKMDLEDIWILHFLDAVSIHEVYSGWKGKKILDFGTGGGLPGVPILILNPDCKMFFLDSVKKKIEAIRYITDNIPVSNAEFLPLRIEDKKMEEYKHYFDVIICRSVKMNIVIKNALEKVLTKDGKIFLYKAKNLDDVEIFNNVKIHKLDLNTEFERRIVEINYG